MDEQANETTFRRVIDEVFNGSNFAVLPELFEPDFIEHQFGLHPTYAGLEKDVRLLRGWFPDLRLTIDELLAHGDRVWVRMTARGHNTGGFMGVTDGKPFEIAIFDLCRFENGKIVEHWGSPDRFAQMVQLGVLPRREPTGTEAGLKG